MPNLCVERSRLDGAPLTQNVGDIPEDLAA